MKSGDLKYLHRRVIKDSHLPCNKQIMDVIVVGCGAAGIAAMRKLHDAGLKVVGLEAANRIGGRIHTVPFGAANVDIGAAWCHGEKDNICFEMASPLGLLDADKARTNFYVQSDGELIPDATGEDILKALDREVAGADKYTTQSISECVRNAANTNSTLSKDPELTKSFIKWFEKNGHLGGEDDPKKGKSLRGLVEFWNSEGEFMINWKGRGYSTILDVLTNKYPDPSKELPLQILLNKEVETIRWGTKSGNDSTNPLVQVVCKDGSLYAAKSVLVTVSVGVLKERHSQLFNPPLPVDKVNTINHLQLCVLGKIYIEFQKPWWPEDAANFMLLWRDEDKNQFSDDEKWVTEIFSLITVSHQPNVLLAWLCGKVVEVMEKKTEEEVRAGVQKLLDVVLVKKFDVSPIKNIIRTKWATDPLTRCAYAYRSVGLEEVGGSAGTLGEPLYHGDQSPVVCFAGEATSPHRHTAVHGAVESGFREANRLIENFKRLGYL